jgi:hypothetical protein
VSYLLCQVSNGKLTDKYFSTLTKPMKNSLKFDNSGSKVQEIETSCSFPILIVPYLLPRERVKIDLMPKEIPSLTEIFAFSELFSLKMCLLRSKRHVLFR